MKYSQLLVHALLIGNIAGGCSWIHKKGERTSKDAPLPPVCDAETDPDCSPKPPQETSFALGETVPDSKGIKTSIGKKDDINGSGQVVAPGVNEVKTLYGADRAIDWSGLDFIQKQKTASESKDEETILQAFNMSYNYIYEQLDELKDAGYSIIQISPPQKTLNQYGIWWELYQPLDHRVFENKLGTEEELRKLVKGAHDRGLRVIADVVLNHMADPLRVAPQDPLRYSNLYQPEDFLNYDIFLDHVRYKFEVLAGDVNEIEYFYSPDRALYKKFTAFLKERGQSSQDVLRDQDSRMVYETAFVRKVMPWMYSDLERLTRDQGVTISWKGDYPSCTQFGQAVDCASNSSFKSTFTSLFGKGALIVRSYYYELTADKHPIYQNEWDSLEKVAVKWYPGLPSLDKRSSVVQGTHVDLLEKMVRLGIDGFRLDAVKHIPQEYFSGLVTQLKDRLQGEDLVVDGVNVLQKPLYVYGEMATSKADIANLYRQNMDVTDFFLLDTYMYTTVFDESFDLYGRGEENLQKLRRSALEKSLKAGNNKNWQVALYPEGASKAESSFTLNDFSAERFHKNLKQAIRFSRIHDSVVGDMFIIKNYQQAMLGHAYMLTATDGRVLVYGSDENVKVNAGADYKEKVVLAANRFRQEAGRLPYSDRFQGKDFCDNCERNDLLFVDRGDQALAILYSGEEALALKNLKFPSLKAGCYVELMSGRRFEVKADQSVLRPRSSTEPTLPGRSAAFILPAACEDKEVLADISFTRETGKTAQAELPEYPVYLMGSFNSWSVDAAYELEPLDDSCLGATVAMRAGQKIFKFADAGWKKLDIGSRDGNALVWNQETRTLNKFGELNETPGNLVLELSEDQNVTIKLCQPTTTFPKLTVTAAAK
ncbi:MAG TPA: alpha-amylase family glycosyl hydrolase [Oligoflexus sp.]|uniref:alpha-amylase family glycosyl hydrolase n=1 Tax=Oligoflexus sp. TaxID=1971216 RepID=UPI002D7FD9AD|nr:alpha-amylase family glycosyl hydrolase [Oligoflexus sp.]HET9240050.1 alpha-amylase family glycosyl hydrolase [Oligoflexus sp.]